MTSAPGQRVRTPVDLGIVIRERRRFLGLDQRTLALRVGVSRQWIVEIEQGKTRAGVGLVLRTLKALGLEATIGSTAPTGTSKSSLAALDLEAIDVDAVVESARAGARAFAPHHRPAETGSESLSGSPKRGGKRPSKADPAPRRHGKRR